MATIRNAITMQDQMTPVFNKMLTAMQKTLDVMSSLDTATKTAMSDTSGIKSAQSAINEASNSVLKLQNHLDALNSTRVSPNVDMSSSGVSAAQMSAIPPNGVLKVEPVSNVFEATTEGAQEARAEALKLQSSINGIRAPSGLEKSIDDSSQAMRNLQGDVGNANREAEELNNTMGKVGKSAKEAGNSMKLINLAAAVSLAKQMYEAVSYSANYLDNLTQIEARLKNINDGSQTTAELQAKILASANRTRGNYQAMADSVAKLNQLAGDTFTSNDQAIAFLEQLNKMFIVSGTGAQEASAAMYQLNQALASGRLQGDEFRSIIENAPMLANAIAESMGVSRAELKELSSQGAITADVILKAMADCSDDVNAQFEKMPVTFGQAMNLIENDFAAKMQGVADAFSSLVNSRDIMIIADAIGSVVSAGAYIAIGAINLLSGALSFLGDNMQWIAPIVMGLATAFTVYTGAVMAYRGAMALATAVTKAHALAESVKMAMTWLASDATFAQTAAQWGLNSALLACPITWIVLGFIALVAVIYAVIGVINTLCGTSLSAMGVIAGAVSALGAIIINCVIFVYNAILSVLQFIINFIQVMCAGIVALWDFAWKTVANIALAVAEAVVNTWNSAVLNVQKFFAQLGKAGATVFRAVATGATSAANALANAFISGANLAIKGINWIISALNKIPGIDIGKVGELGKVSVRSDTSGIDNYIGQMDAILNKSADKVSFGRLEYDNYSNPELVTLPKADYTSIKDAYNSGYEWGSNLESKIGGAIGDFFSGEGLGITDGLAQDVSNMSDMMGNLDNSNIDNVGKVDSIGSIDDDIDLSDEDIKMLKDIATHKYVNKYTTLQPNVNVTFGDVHETADVDKIMDAIADMTEQALAETILEEEG